MATKDELGRALQAAHEAGDDESARTLAAAYAAAPEDKAMSVGDIATGVGDVAVSAARGLVNQPSVTLNATLGGLVNMLPGGVGFKEGYRLLKQQGREDIESGNELVQSERLRTPQGERVASAIANAPGFKQVNQALESIGGGIEKYAGPEARDIAGSIATLATLKGPRAAAPVTDAAKAVRDMRNAGYIVPPTTSMGAGKLAGPASERVLASVSGGVDNAIAVKNQVVTDRFAARAARLSEDTTTPAGVEKATKQADDAYVQMKKLDVPVALQTPQFITDTMALGKGIAGFSDKTDKAIVRLQNSLLTAEPRVPNIVDKVRELRRDSFLNKAADDPARQRLGIAQRQAADILDNSLDQFLQRLAGRYPGRGIEQLHAAYLDARSQLSTLHTIRDAMNPTTGSIDAAKIAQAATEKKLPAPLQVIANAYNANPKALRSVEKVAPSADFKVNLVGTSVGAGVGASLGGVPGAVIGAIAPTLARFLAREYVTRGKQARLAQKAVGQANRTTARTIAAQHMVEDEQP